LTVAYNHHFESTMAGGHAEHKKITLNGPDDPQIEKYGLRMAHSMYFGAGSEHWVVDERNSDSGIPTKQAFGGANGGEVRKSFHGYAPGFAQIIQSPKTFQITPMQIDTWNRDEMPLTSPSPFVAGPLPRNSLAPASAKYSGLLECPVTTRIRKDVDGDYMAIIRGECGGAKVQSAGECFESASQTLALSSHKVNVVNSTVADSSRPPARSLEASADGGIVTVYFNDASDSTVQCGASVTKRAGISTSLVTLGVALDFSKDEASISITGPSDVWFGVGFNASAMKDAPWAIVVDGNGDVTERKLHDQNPGAELANSVTVVSNSADGGFRTVVMTRPMKGETPDHFTFSADQEVVLPFINAIGRTATLSYHKEKMPSTLALLPSDGAPASTACVCAKDPPQFGDASGTLSYMPTAQAGEAGFPSTIKFDNKCHPFPRTDLLEMKNPTCDIRTYTGGQIACHHMFSLLDADQEIPWVDQPLAYHLKFRFWYQDYNASYHKNVKRSTWGIGSLVEYDVPKCSADIQGCELDSNGDWIHTITGTYTGNDYMVAAHFHCHAPTCQSIKMYRDWNGTHGELMCEERPVYGGTGQVDQEKYDEDGFILQPPCLWGSEEQGLEAPPDVNGRTLHTVKTSYANDGHHGEMAWQQMYLVTALGPDADAQIFV